jgi:hypothetical protein
MFALNKNSINFKETNIFQVFEKRGLENKQIF